MASQHEDDTSSQGETVAAMSGDERFIDQHDKPVLAPRQRCMVLGVSVIVVVDFCLPIQLAIPGLLPC